MQNNNNNPNRGEKLCTYIQPALSEYMIKEKIILATQMYLLQGNPDRHTKYKISQQG